MSKKKEKVFIYFFMMTYNLNVVNIVQPGGSEFIETIS